VIRRKRSSWRIKLLRPSNAPARRSLTFTSCWGNLEKRGSGPNHFTFTLSDGDIDSDDGPYESEPGMNVFIGSRANLGNIFIKGDGSFTAPLPNGSRLLFLNFSNCNTTIGPCDLPLFSTGLFTSGNVRAGFVVDVNKAVKEGVYAIGPDQTEETAPMRLQFQQPGDDVAHDQNWFLYFDPKKKNCEDSGEVDVENTGSGVWTVSGTGLTGCVVQQTGPNTEPVGFFDMTFSFDVMIQ